MKNPLQRRSPEESERRVVVANPVSGEPNWREIAEMATQAGNGGDDLQILSEYAGILWKRRLTLLTMLLLGGIIALAVALWTVPTYQAIGSVEIQNVPEAATPLVTSSPAIATQAQLLGSLALKERTVSKLKGRTSDPNTEAVGSLASVRQKLGLADPGKSIKWDAALGMAAGLLTISPPKEGSIIYIRTTSPNPQVSAEFINTLAEEYLARNEEERWASYQATGSWLARAQEGIKEKLEESEVRLAEFAKTKGLLYTSGGTDNAAEDKLKTLQGNLLAVSAERISKQAEYEASLSSPTEALPSVLDSGPMGTYQVKLADLRRELADLSTTLTPAHYRRQQVEAQIAQVEQDAKREQTNIINRIRIQYDQTVKQENQLRRAFESQTQVLASQSTDSIRYSILQHEVETNRKLYENTLTQGKEASLASAMRTSGARIVDRAKPSSVPVKPALLVYLGLGMFAGLICGAVFIVAGARSDMRVQGPGAVEMQLNLRELGVIPAPTSDWRMRLLPSTESNGKSVAGKGILGLKSALGKTNPPPRDLALVVQNAKLSQVAEAFRSLMTSILYAGQDTDRPQVLVITSALPQEGKSTVVSNLGIALAEIGQRVLLIDADMRRPRLHSIFDVPNTFGLSDVLHERKPIEEYPLESLVRRTEVADLDLLPAGPARATLPRLLHSTRVRELFAELRRTYDIILVDSPPTLNVPDARSLARAADAVVLVVRAHQTQHDEIFAAARCLAEDGCRILGTVLNGFDPKISAYGRYQSYGGYYPRATYKNYSS